MAMTEAWIREMKKIEKLSPHEDLLARAERGPSMPQPPQRPRARLGAAVVATVVFGAAAAFAWNAFSPSDRTAPADGAGVFMAVDPTSPNAVTDAALLTAPVVVRDGCVLVGEGSDLTLPIWPKGYTANRDAAGRLVVKDANGSVVAVEGTQIVMGGGYVAEFQPADKVAPKASQVTRVESSLGYPIPDSCLAAIYGIWQVGELSPLSGSPAPSSPSISAKTTFASGSDALAGPWHLFFENRDYGPVMGVSVPDQQTFTVELKPLGGRTFGAWSITGVSDNTLLLVQVLDPSASTAEIKLDDGTVVQGEIVDLPSDVIGPAKVLVAGFESRMSAEGTSYDPDGVVVAYGSQGQELGRWRISSG
jgi:hypothetical protein